MPSVCPPHSRGPRWTVPSNSWRVKAGDLMERRKRHHTYHTTLSSLSSKIPAFIMLFIYFAGSNFFRIGFWGWQTFTALRSSENSVVFPAFLVTTLPEYRLPGWRFFRPPCFLRGNLLLLARIRPYRQHTISLLLSRAFLCFEIFIYFFELGGVGKQICGGWRERKREDGGGEDFPLSNSLPIQPQQQATCHGDARSLVQVSCRGFAFSIKKHRFL